jgi:hypothetical protein
MPTRIASVGGVVLSRDRRMIEDRTLWAMAVGSGLAVANIYCLERSGVHSKNCIEETRRGQYE